MSDWKYRETPTAVMLREMHAAGLSWRLMADRIGYHHTTLHGCATGRHRAGDALARDVAHLYAQGRAD